jgi:hypothetical protein
LTATAETQLARVVFALLVVASFAAFFITQRLKHAPTLVQGVKLVPAFSPTPQGHIKVERLSFRIEHSDDVTVTVIDSKENPVRTLIAHHHLLAYRRLKLRWDGLTERGSLAPAGTYRIRVNLLRQQRSVLFTRSFELVIPTKAAGS